MPNAVTKCPKSEVKKRPAAKETQIKIKCKHRGCPEGKEILPFEIIPDVGTFSVDEKITVDWSGDQPPAPPVLKLSNGNVISGPPYVIPLKFGIREDEEIYPQAYLRYIQSGSTMDFTIDFLKAIFTHSYNRTILIKDLPWGHTNIIIRNPDRWKIEVALPFKKKSVIKGGVKWDKDIQGKVSKATTSQKNTADEERTIETAKSSQFIGSRQVMIEKTSDTLKLNDGKTILEGKREVTKASSTMLPGGVTTVKNSLDASASQVIKVSYNSTLLDFNGLKMILFIAQVIKYAAKLKEVLDDIPKAGAYIDYEFSAMDGNFSIEFGWKEYAPDHRAYYGVGANFDITLLQIKGELGVGISGFSVKFQAFCSLEGKFSINAGFENNKPVDEEGDKKGETKGIGNKVNKFGYQYGIHAKADLTAEITGTIGARCEALYFVKIEATLKSGLKMSGAIELFNKEDLVTIDTAIKFTGIVGSVTTSVGFSGVSGDERTAGKKSLSKKLKEKFTDSTNVGIEGERKHSTGEPKECRLMDEHMFWQFKFPNDLNNYEPDKKEAEQKIKWAIREMINGKYLNSGFFRSGKIRVKELLTSQEWSEESSVSKVLKYGILNKAPVKDVDDEELADIIYSAFKSEPCLDLSMKSLELMLLEIRRDLEPLMREGEGESFTFSYISKGDFTTYVNRDLRKKLANFKDPAAEFLQQHGA
jgi:hypothetical protein